MTLKDPDARPVRVSPLPSRAIGGCREEAAQSQVIPAAGDPVTVARQSRNIFSATVQVPFFDASILAARPKKLSVGANRTNRPLVAILVRSVSMRCLLNRNYHLFFHQTLSKSLPILARSQAGLVSVNQRPCRRFGIVSPEFCFNPIVILRLSSRNFVSLFDACLSVAGRCA